MIIERNHFGAVVISAFVGEGAREYLLTETYYDYTPDEAKAKFLVKLKREEERLK